MSGTSTETLTAALRRLADEHASGLLAVVTPGRDVVLELADGVPVGIGPSHDVSGRIGRDAGASLVAAAVVDDLVDRTVAAIVGGGGTWTWDVSSDADMMPVPEGLVAELSRRAVDAAEALARLDPEQVLQPARDLETSGDVARLRALFDGQRSIEDVAAQADLTLPAVATVAAALVRAGVLSTGMDDSGPPSWTDTVAGADTETDEDEPELWVMDEPDEPDLPEELDAQEDEDVTPASPAATDTAATDTERADDEEITEAMAWIADDDGEPASAQPAEDRDWDDTTWLDELDSDSQGPSDDGAPPVVEADGDDELASEVPQDARAVLSSMISELQGSGAGQVRPRQQPPPADPPDENDEDGEDGDDEQRATARATDATRKEPKAEPGEVAEFLRELSRLALDDD